jgi:hypothetical protein
MIGQFHVARRMIVGAADDRETLPKSRISKSMVDPKTIALARGAFRRVPTPLAFVAVLKSPQIDKARLRLQPLKLIGTDKGHATSLDVSAIAAGV